MAYFVVFKNVVKYAIFVLLQKMNNAKKNFFVAFVLISKGKESHRLKITSFAFLLREIFREMSQNHYFQHPTGAIFWGGGVFSETIEPIKK